MVKGPNFGDYAFNNIIPLFRKEKKGGFDLPGKAPVYPLGLKIRQ